MARELDEKTQALVDKATTNGAKAERKRINDIISSATSAAGDIEDRDQKRAVKDALKTVKDEIKTGAGV